VLAGRGSADEAPGQGRISPHRLNVAPGQQLGQGRDRPLDAAQVAPQESGKSAAAGAAAPPGGAPSPSQTAALEHSYAGRLGRAIEPLISPLGFDWKIGIGLIGAFAAREVFVSTMAVVYDLEDSADQESPRLRERVASQTRPNGQKLFTPAVCLSLMVFFALACQCLSTLAVVRQESRSLAWPAFLFLYMTALAWLAASPSSKAPA
jgi:ferrous iron transport protein B